MKTENTDKKIALVAGALDLPFFTRDALRRAGWDVFVIGLKNFVDMRLNPDMVIRLGGAGRAVRAVRRLGIKKVVFVGALGHPNLSDLRPDFWSLRMLLKIIKHQRGYDSMAVAFNKVLEKQGFEIVAAQDLAPELTFETAGVQTKKKPTASDEKNIARAIEVSHLIGAADIGASVVVDKHVLGVEAAEGTARMLELISIFISFILFLSISLIFFLSSSLSILLNSFANSSAEVFFNLYTPCSILLFVIFPSILLNIFAIYF